MSDEDDRQDLFYDMYRCFEPVANDLSSCEIYCLETRTGIGYFDSVESAERAFFLVVMDCDAVYLENNALVLRRIHPRQYPYRESNLKVGTDPTLQKDDSALQVQTFDAMVYDEYDDITEPFS